MSNKTEYIFAGALTIDGTVVNAFQTNDKREILKRLNDDRNSFWSRQKPENVHPRHADDIVYLWVSEND